MYSRTKKSIFMLLTSSIAMTFNASAKGLPQVQAPSRGGGSGILDTIKNHAYDGIILVGLVVCAIAFLIVFKNCLSTYSQIQENKKTWTDLILMASVGVVVLVIGIWLISEASDIL